MPTDLFILDKIWQRGPRDDGEPRPRNWPSMLRPANVTYLEWGNSINPSSLVPVSGRMPGERDIIIAHNRVLTDSKTAWLREYALETRCFVIEVSGGPLVNDDPHPYYYARRQPVTHERSSGQELLGCIQRFLAGLPSESSGWTDWSPIEPRMDEFGKLLQSSPLATLARHIGHKYILRIFIDREEPQLRKLLVREPGHIDELKKDLDNLLLLTEADSGQHDVLGLRRLCDTFLSAASRLGDASAGAAPSNYASLVKARDELNHALRELERRRPSR